MCVSPCSHHQILANPNRSFPCSGINGEISFYYDSHIDVVHLDLQCPPSPIINEEIIFFVGFHIDVPHSNCSCKYSRHPCGCNMIESGLKSSLIDLNWIWTLGQTFVRVSIEVHGLYSIGTCLLILIF